MTSFFKAMLGISLAILLARVGMLEGLRDQIDVWERVALLFFSLGWTIYSVMNAIHYLCNKKEM